MAKKGLRKKRAAKKGKPESPAAALARQKHEKMTPEERSEHARLEDAVPGRDRGQFCPVSPFGT